jgi:hypothetical protein
MRGEAGYQPAAVCRRGHVQTGNINFGEYGEKCPTRGAKVIVQCESCEQRKRWERVKKMAPQLWESSQPLITTLVSAAVQGKL